jgi:YesN/AraC family two-component response regulator
MGELTGRDMKCGYVHLYGAYQADRFGGKCIYFCPMSLLHWASPILVDGMMEGAMIAGPALVIEPDEFFHDAISGLEGLSQADIEELKKVLAQIPFISTEKASSLSQLLFMSSFYLSTVDGSSTETNQEQVEQQSRIGEYIQYIKTMGGSTDTNFRYPIEKEKELQRLIVRGDKIGAKKVLNEILGSVLFASGNNLEMVKARVLELVVLLSRAAMEGGADVEEIFGLNYRYLNQVHKHKTVEDLAYWLSQIMVRFTDFVFDFRSVKHADSLFRAVEYIKKHYTEHISLEEVAAKVFLSPAYFSKIFKEEMKCNFTAYVNRLRIDQSKNLLKETNIPLVDIAGMVGYEDQSYFTKVFRKITGTSPGKYREMRGYISSDQEIHDNG